MVLDFGFLKEEMLRIIDHSCDHGFIAEVEDIEILKMFTPHHWVFDTWVSEIANNVKAHGFMRFRRKRVTAFDFTSSPPPQRQKSWRVIGTRGSVNVFTRVATAWQFLIVYASGKPPIAGRNTSRSPYHVPYSVAPTWARIISSYRPLCFICRMPASKASRATVMSCSRVNAI